MQTQQFGVIKLMAYLGCDAECGFKPSPLLVLPADGDEQASNQAVVDRRLASIPIRCHVSWILVMVAMRADTAFGSRSVEASRTWVSTAQSTGLTTRSPSETVISIAVAKTR